MQLTASGRLNLRITGDGPSTIFHWGGDAGNGSAHFMQFRNGCTHFEADHFAVKQKDLTNPDTAEQHHLFHLTHTNSTAANNEFFRFHHIDFGVVKGDAINLTGSQDTNALHTGFAGTVASGAMAGPFNNPANPQCVCVDFPSGWDGGNFTFTGTDIDGNTITETVVAEDNAIVCGEREFVTITGVNKSATGASASVATLGYAFWSRYVSISDCTFNGFDYAGSDPGYDYRSAILV